MIKSIISQIGDSVSLIGDVMSLNTVVYVTQVGIVPISCLLFAFLLVMPSYKIIYCLYHWSHPTPFLGEALQMTNDSAPSSCTPPTKGVKTFPLAKWSDLQISREIEKHVEHLNSRGAPSGIFWSLHGSLDIHMVIPFATLPPSEVYCVNIHQDTKVTLKSAATRGVSLALSF